jgi:pimeloyl-ACP methyl ester carboxylesterase
MYGSKSREIMLSERDWGEGGDSMPYARNALDGTWIYFEDDGGVGSPVILYGGILDSVDLVRGSHIAQALHALPDEFRLIYVDHRGLGQSDKPHDVEAYAMPLRVADASAVLTELGIERAHFIGTSYGGRLCFGIGEHAPEHVLSLVIGGQQPYAIDPNGPLTSVVVEGVAASRTEGIEAFVKALERFAGIRLPDVQRIKYLESDPVAVGAASNAMLVEGTIAKDLQTWRFPCLIFVGAGDADFFKQARRAADEIPNAEFLALEGVDHVGAHLQHDFVIPAVLRTLRATSN